MRVPPIQNHGLTILIPVFISFIRSLTSKKDGDKHYDQIRMLKKKKTNHKCLKSRGQSSTFSHNSNRYQTCYLLKTIKLTKI